VVREEDILLRLTLDKRTGIMELAIIDNTIKDSMANQLLYPLAMGMSVILEEEPDLLYEAGTELHDGEKYVKVKSDTMH